MARGCLNCHTEVARVEQPEHDQPDAAVQAALERSETAMKGTRHALSRTILGLAVTAALRRRTLRKPPIAAALKRPDTARLRLAAGSPPEPRATARSGPVQRPALRNDANLLLDIDFVRRDDATGTWTTLRGRNLGLELARHLLWLPKAGRLEDRARLQRARPHEIRTINTGMLGAGSKTPQVVLIAPGTGQDLNFEMKRKAIGLAGDKWISSGVQMELSFRNEDKGRHAALGPRLRLRELRLHRHTKRGEHPLGGVMIPEPVNFNMKTVDAKLNFTAEKLFVSAGYYGSFFGNEFGNVAPSVPNQLRGPTGLTRR
jgi:hypothetical protein